MHLTGLLAKSLSLSYSITINFKTPNTYQFVKSEECSQKHEDSKSLSLKNQIINNYLTWLSKIS